MDIKNNLNLLDGLFTRSNNAQNPQGTPPPPRTSTSKDIVSISDDKLKSLRVNASKLVSEDIEKIENGFRRTQTFETAKGGTFTRVEEQTTTPDKSKRLVIQQNESGSTTILENILDRQDDGSFRETQRFTNEVGETSTNITYDVPSRNAEQLLGLPSSPESNPKQPFEPIRGTQYDVIT